MAKKLVLIGPSGVGKSTLRKWLFEGENVFKLLENPMEPTYGFENYSYNLLQNLGVFDLAGQETERWFNEEQEIFDESDIIINVVDARNAVKIITNYIERAIQIQTSRSKDANIFFLIHKVDLIDKIDQEKVQKAIEQLSKKMKRDLKREIDWHFTSIRSNYLVPTVGAFIEIMQKSGLDKDSRLNAKLIQLNAELFQNLQTQKVISTDKILHLLKGSKSNIQALISTYEEAGLLRTKKMEKEILIYLTEKGEAYYEQVIKSFEDISHDKELEQPLLEDKSQNSEYWIYGIMISDSNGKTLVVAETKPDSLKEALNRANNPQFDLELIPMFLNAMSKFAEEINVKDLSSFRVQGGNLKMSSLSKQNLTLTIFTHPDFQIDLVKDDFGKLFDGFFTDFAKNIEEFDKTGNATKFFEFVPSCVEIITKVATKYLKLQEQLSKFNLEDAKKLYAELNQVDEGNITLEDQLRIKSLKVKLLETILAEDAIQFQNIEQEIQNLL